MEAWIIAIGILTGLAGFFLWLLLREKEKGGEQKAKDDIAEANKEAMEVANKTVEGISSLSSSDLRERSKRWVRKD